MRSRKKIKLIEHAFGKGFLETDEKNVHVSCPECNDSRKDKKKLYISLDTGWYNCWVCNTSGKNIGFLFRKYATCYYEKCREIFSCDAIGLESKEEIKIAPVELPDDVSLITNNMSDPDTRAVYSYLLQRGLTRMDMFRWRVCVSNNFYFRRKAIFPSFDATGKLNYYVARCIDETKFKYNNAKVPKSSVIFNEVDLDWEQPVILVEGVFDAVKCPDNTAVALGSTLSKTSLLYKQLVKNRATVIVCFDEDADEKSHQVCKRLNVAGCTVYRVSVSGQDLGDRTKKGVMKVISKAKIWTSEALISHKISCIKSGSLL